MLALFMFVITACGGSSGSVPDEVSERFDLPSTWIANLTDPGDEQFSEELVFGAIGQARALGTDLRVVVVGSQDERPSPEGIVDKYGGTVLVYKANDREFFAHSADMSNEQLARAAQGSASNQPTISDSVSGFVQQINADGGLEGGSFFDTLLRWILLPLAALFMLVMLVRYLQARNSARNRLGAFEERRRSLADWAGQLPGEIDALRGAVALAGDESRATLGEVENYSATVGSKISAAENMGDLDAVEMRLGRAFIKLRDLRKTVNA